MPAEHKIPDPRHVHGRENRTWGRSHPVGLDYSISPGEWCGLGSFLSDLFGLLPGRTLSARQFDGAGPSAGVADEYFAVTEKVEALYGQSPRLPADAIGSKMARLRREHYRMLGNGYCTRPAELDCAFESICETCTYFQTSIEFRPALAAQRNHAAVHGRTSRQELFAQLLTQIDDNQAS